MLVLKSSVFLDLEQLTVDISISTVQHYLRFRHGATAKSGGAVAMPRATVSNALLPRLSPLDTQI